MTNVWRYSLTLLVLSLVGVWMTVFGKSDENLHLIACDVGQGDGILITYESTQILIDGGPDNKIIDCLSKHMSTLDRTIEVVILTNPDLDHYGGLIEVFQRYNVEKFVESPLPDSTQGYVALMNAVGGSGVTPIRPTVGQSIVYGLMHLDILYPDLSLDQGFENPQNNNSTVLKLAFGEFEAILTGDIEDPASDFISETINIGEVEYIKVPHHGSKNGLTKMLLGVTSPEIAVISAGKKNRYGHPHQEVLDTLNEMKVETYGTYDLGDIEVVTDGKEYWLK